MFDIDMLLEDSRVCQRIMALEQDEQTGEFAVNEAAIPSLAKKGTQTQKENPTGEALAEIPIKSALTSGPPASDAERLLED